MTNIETAGGQRRNPGAHPPSGPTLYQLMTPAESRRARAIAYAAALAVIG